MVLNASGLSYAISARIFLSNFIPDLFKPLINGLNKSGIKIDRKILAEIAYDNPEAFKTIVKKAQAALN